MQDKIVVITGATSGIGLGIARRFAKEQAKLVINGLINVSNPDHDNTGNSDMNIIVNKLVAELTSLGAQDVMYNDSDLADPASIKNMFSRVLNHFGKVDILVNNAGIQFVAPIEEFPDATFENIIRINLAAAFYTIKSVIPAMKYNKWGRIINIASAHGLVASPFKSAYVAAKHGLVGLTKTAALELAPYDITVNAICPGYVKTPLVLNQIGKTAEVRNIPVEKVIDEIILSTHANKKFIEVEEIAELAYYLSGKHAASITGATFQIDGGWTAK